MIATGKMPGYLLEPEIARASTQSVSPTAVPVFIGYVDRLDVAQQGVATMVTRFAEYVRYFGGGSASGDAQPWAEQAPVGSLLQHGPFLRSSIHLYFLNGGGPCYVLPVGVATAAALPQLEDFALVVSTIDHVPDITLVVPTDAILLPEQEYYDFCNALLAHCAASTNRFCILDAGSVKPLQGSGYAQARKFGQALSGQHLAFGAAYFPFLQLSNTVSDSAGELVTASPAGLRIGLSSAVVAAAYGTTDQARGIWKAPANVAVSSVVGITPTLSLREMGLLYEPEDGRAVNLMRSIHGRGIFVWGARTLAAQDLEWRHVNVRRLMSFVEATLRTRTLFAVFEPNSLRTWIVLKGLCESFLKGLWEAGGLAGRRKDDAYSVQVGLGDSMTQADIDEGRLIIIIRLAAKRPAEFITIRLFHQVQALGNQ